MKGSWVKGEYQAGMAVAMRATGAQGPEVLLYHLLLLTIFGLQAEVQLPAQLYH